MYLATIIGLLLGIISGIVPGIHPNLIALLVAGTLLENREIIIFVAAMSYTFLSTIPTIYLSAPDADSALSLHPSQKYAVNGRAHEAVILILIGTLISLSFMMALMPLFKKILKPFYHSIENLIPFLLLITALFLILHQNKKIMAAIIFVLSGALGYAALNINLTDPLLPLFTGLFGIPALIVGMQSTNVRQKITQPKLSKKSLKIILVSLFYGSFFSFLPSLGPAQAATVQTHFSKNTSKKDFLILMGCLSTINTIFSIVTLMELNAARNGAIAIIRDLGSIDLKMLNDLLAISLIIAFPSTLLCLCISRGFIRIKNSVNQKMLSRIIILFLFSITLLISHLPGIMLLIFATVLGYLPYKINVTKTTLMGSLMIPTMIFYFSRMF